MLTKYSVIRHKYYTVHPYTWYKYTHNLLWSLLWLLCISLFCHNNCTGHRYQSTIVRRWPWPPKTRKPSCSRFQRPGFGWTVGPRNDMNIPSDNFTNSLLLKMAHFVRWFTPSKWWFSSSLCKRLPEGIWNYMEIPKLFGFHDMSNWYVWLEDITLKFQSPCWDMGQKKTVNYIHLVHWTCRPKSGTNGSKCPNVFFVGTFDLYSSNGRYFQDISPYTTLGLMLHI